MAFIKVSKYGVFIVIAIVLVIGSLWMLRAKADSQAAATQEISDGSQLPLISFLGFGMLAGGIICARRTRPEKQQARS